MNKLYTKLFILFGLALGANVAQADLEEGKNALQVGVAFTQGGPALGLEFEHGYDKTYGIGGYFRMYPEDEGNDPDYTAPGMTVVGGFIRPHFNRQNWDFYVSPGFAFIDYDPNEAGEDNETYLGPSLSIGLLYEMQPNMAFGIDQMTHWGWFGEEAYMSSIRGINDLMAKFRFVF